MKQLFKIVGQTHEIAECLLVFSKVHEQIDVTVASCLISGEGAKNTYPEHPIALQLALVLRQFL
jgi:hypothetical protein